MSNPIMKPVYIHDCDKCVYLGTVLPRIDDDVPIDCYWCANDKFSALSSVLGRYGNNGAEYALSYPPKAFTAKDKYLLVADRWYLFAMLQATLRGLYKR